MSSNEFLKDAYWKSDYDGVPNWSSLLWYLYDRDGDIIATLRKEKGWWFGRVLPNTKDHLVPQQSLHTAMKQTIGFIKARET